MNIELITRGLLFVLYALIAVFAQVVAYKRRNVRHYARLVFWLAAVNVVFYGLSLSWRLGVFATPTPHFFSDLSNFRSWVTAIAAALVMGYEAWIGQR